MTVKKKRNAEACVFIFGGCAPSAICSRLEAADVIAGRRIRRAAQELGKSLDVADIIVLRLVAEVAVRHVLQHAAAQIADGRGDCWRYAGGCLGHRGACLEVGAIDPFILKTGAPGRYL